MKTVTVCEYGVSAAFEVYSFGAGAPHVMFTAGVHGNEACGASPVFCGPLQDAQAPCAGLWSPQIARGVRVAAGQIIGTVDGKEVCAPAHGQVMSVLPRAYLLPDDLWVMTYTVPRGE